MLELKYLTKTYRPKKGEPVQALKGITLSFDDTGLVFILGKSGSGKSTLLNLIGGLDFADGGEIVIDGKSTKAFKESDYDSYRNTYIGFVFQEYNLLDEFTVGENVSLALELQSQKSDKARLDEILKQVDLDGYAGRKINELSGGQKQRVAIARAIVKNPKIVMADEPTGALDSVTGRAIFDTLKKLSEDKLVIVVSHDRDFAEQYGDRIIELADGEVVADNTKEKSKSADGAITEKENSDSARNTAAKDNRLIKSHLPYARAFKMGAKSLFIKPIRLVITVILCLVSFAFFGISDTIASYNSSKIALNALLNNDNDSLVFTRDYGALYEDIDKVKDKADIDSLGVANIGYDAQDLPIVYRRKVNGTNGVYYNTMLFGYLPASKVIDGVKYRLIAGKMPSSDYEIVISKYTYEQLSLGGIAIVDGDETIYIEPEEIATTTDFLAKAYLQISYGNIQVMWKVVGIVDTLADPDGRYEKLKADANANLSQEQYDYLKLECAQYFAYSYHSLGYVTENVYNQILAMNGDDVSFGVKSQGRYNFIKTDSDGRETLYGGAFDVVASLDELNGLDIVWSGGVARSTLADNEFVVGLDVVNAIGNGLSEYTTVYLNNMYFDGLIDFSKNNFILANIKQNVGLIIGACEYAEQLDMDGLSEFVNFINSIGGEQLDDEEQEYCRRLALNDCYNTINWYLDEDYEFDFYAQEFSLTQWQILYAGYLMCDELQFYGMINSVDGGYNVNVVSSQPSGEQISSDYGEKIYNQCLINYAFNCEFDSVKYSYTFSNDKQVTLENSPKIVGVYLADGDGDMQVVANNVLYAGAQAAPTPDYMFLIAPMTSDKTALKCVVEMNESGEMYLQNSVMLALQYRGDIFAATGRIFLYVGLGLAVFSIILMGNFITATVASKKREIGILRALGAKTADVFSIFYSESLIIAIFNFILATVAVGIASIVLSAQIAADLSMKIAFMTFGIRQIALIFLLSIGTSLVASLLSIYAIAKRKPIDCILDK